MFVSSVRLHSCHIVGPNNIMRDPLNAFVYIKFIVNVDYLQKNTCTCLVGNDVSFK